MLLGLLLLGKGNMAAMFGIGHVQLGVAQVYMPWIIGAAYRLLRGDQARWLVALLGMAFALQFLAGNVWHVLPTLIAVSVLTLAYATAWRGLARLASASVITLGLSAVVLLPLMVNQPYIGGAADPVTGGDRSMPAQVALRQMVTAEVLVTAPELGLAVSEAETRYNYTLPLWFAALMLVVLPPIPGWLYRARLPDERRVWVVGGALFVFFTLWGVGGVAPFRWAYDTLPGLDRWRFVGRAFGMGTFWLALLVALRVDRLGAALWAREQLSRRVRQGLVAAVGITALLAGGQVTAHTWREWVRLVPATPANAACLDWLRANTPVSPLVEVAQVNYNTVYGFLDRICASRRPRHPIDRCRSRPRAGTRPPAGRASSCPRIRAPSPRCKRTAMSR